MGGSDASQMSLNCNKWLGSKRKSTDNNEAVTSQHKSDSPARSYKRSATVDIKLRSNRSSASAESPLLRSPSCGSDFNRLLINQNWSTDTSISLSGSESRAISRATSEACPSIEFTTTSGESDVWEELTKFTDQSNPRSFDRRLQRLRMNRKRLRGRHLRFGLSQQLKSSKNAAEPSATLWDRLNSCLNRYKLVRLASKDLMKLIADSRYAQSFALHNKFRLSCLCTEVDFTEGEISLVSTEFQTRNQTYTQRILAEYLGCQIIPEKVCLCCDAIASMPRCAGYVLKPFLLRQPLNRGQHLYKKWRFHKHCTCCFDPVNAEQVVERLTRCYSNTPDERSYWQIAKQVPLLLPWSLKFSVVGLPEYLWLLHDKYQIVSEVTEQPSAYTNEGGCFSEKIPRKSTSCGRKIEKSRRTATATTAVVSELIKDSVSRQRVREQELSSRSQLSLNPHHKLSFRLELRNRCLFPSKSHWYVRALETGKNLNERFYAPRPNDKVCASVLTGSLKPSRSSLALASNGELSYVFPKNPAPETLSLRVLLEHAGFDANQNNKTDLIASKCYSLDNPILTSCLGFQHLKFDASELLTANTGIHNHDNLRQSFGIPIFAKLGLESYSPKGLSRLIDEVEQEHRTCSIPAISKSFDFPSSDGVRYPGATTVADVSKRGDPIQMDRFQRMIWLSDFGIDVNLAYPGMWDKMLFYAKRLDEFVKKGKVLQQRNDSIRIARRGSMDFSFANGLRRVSMAIGQLEQRVMKRSLSLDSGMPTLDTKLADFEASDEDNNRESKKVIESENCHKQRDSKPSSVQDNGMFNFQQAIQLMALSDPHKSGLSKECVTRRSVRRTTEDLTNFVRNTRVLRLEDFRRITQLATLPGPNGQKLIQLLETYDRISESTRIKRTDESSGLLKQQSQQIKLLQRSSEQSVENYPLRKKRLHGMDILGVCLYSKKSAIEETPRDLSKLLPMHRRAQIELKMKHLDDEMEAALKHSEEQRELIRQILHEYHRAQRKTLLRRNRQSFRQLQKENRSTCIQFLGLMGMMRLRYKGIAPSSVIDTMPSTTDQEDSFVLMQLKKLINGQENLRDLLQRRHENERQSIEVAMEEEHNAIEEQFQHAKEILLEQSLSLQQ